MAQPYDLVIVGMGSGGGTAAMFAAQLDLRVAAIERDRIGGDCLWTGCVPSKALLASAKVAHHMRTADRFGLPAVDPEIDAARVWQRIHAIREDIAATDDSPERFEEMGVEIVTGTARLAGPNAIRVGERELQSRFILLATGSRPAVPPVPGLEEAGFLSSETIFELDRPSASVVVIGGGPIGVELSQGLRRLGTEVTLLQKGPRLLARDEPELTDVLTDVIEAEGVSVHRTVTLERVTVENGLKVVHGTEAGAPKRWQAEDIIVAAGRAPNVEGLGLEEVGVQAGPRGIETDQRMRTSVKSIYATGDLAGRNLFTHSAGYESAMAVRDMFFPGKARLSDLVPWCTFTDPELGHVGLTVAEARERYGDDKVKVHRAELAESDRARADGATDGAVVLVSARGRLVGGHVLSTSAGELIHELVLAVSEKKSLEDLSMLVHVYPTYTTTLNLLAARAAYEKAKRLSWIIRRSKAA